MKTIQNTDSLSQSILDFIEKIEQHGVPLHAFLLQQHGTLLAEGYYAPYQKDQLHRMFSICKSLNALAIGLLEEEGKLSLEDKVLSYFPEKAPEKPHPFVAAMTIKNLLMMRTCHASTTYKQDKNQEWVTTFFHVPPTHKPGTVFHYDTSAAHVLCMLVERVAGKPMLSYLREKVLDEIGWSKESYVLPNPFGDPQGGSGLMCTPNDLLLLGQLLLQKGNWKGKQLLPKTFVETATSNLTPNVMTGPVASEMQGYGYQIWQGEKDNFVLYGMGGQLVLCFPKEDCVFVTCADTQGMGGGNQFLYDSFYETIYPLLQENATKKETFVPTEALKKRLSSLQLAPVSKTAALCYPSLSAEEENNIRHSLVPTSSNATDIDGLCFHITSPNSLFSDIKLAFDQSGQEGILSYTLKKQHCTLPFGLQNCLSGRFPLYDMNCATSGLWIAPDTFYLKCHLLDTSLGSVSMEFVFGETDGKPDVTIFSKKIEETMFGEYQTHLHGILSSTP